MDVFHKVLTKIYEISGGRETHEVDFVDLLKKEGFYSHRDSIKNHLSTEGWITDAPRPHHVQITHWGMAEAKKTLSGTDRTTSGPEPQIERLHAASRELNSAVEKLGPKTEPSALKAIEERVAEINYLISEIKKHL